MVFASERRGAQLDAFFTQSSARFAQWLGTPIKDGNGAAGFRISAIPATAPLELGRLYGMDGLTPVRQNYTVANGLGRFQAHLVRLPERTRPIVRGVRRTFDVEGVLNYLEMHSDGRIDLGFRVGPRQEQLMLTSGWIMAYTIFVLQTADRMRTLAGAPHAEYVLEVELGSSCADPVEIFRLDPSSSDPRLGDPLRLPLTLPRLSLGPASEVDQAINVVMTDLYDAVGEPQPAAASFKVVG